jgi:hypothetical protein
MRFWPALPLLLIATAAIADWRAASWGGGPDAVDGRVIEPGLIYGAGLTARVVSDAKIGGLAFRALWQFDDAGLRQVLMERRGADAGVGDAADLFDALAQTYGAPDAICAAPPKGGRPGAAELIWTAPEGTLHAVWFDFSGGYAFARTVADLLHPFSDAAPPGTPDIDPNRAQAERRAIRGQSPEFAGGGLHARALPRRLLLRWHDPAAERLATGASGCGG